MGCINRQCSCASAWRGRPPSSSPSRAFSPGMYAPPRYFSPPTAQRRRSDRPFPRMEQVEVVRNVVYARVRGRPLKLDLYLPRRPLQGANLAPAVLYIHGGGWVTGHRRFASLPLLYHLASHGVAVATVDYRLAPANRFPAQLRDTKRALQWLRQHALRRGIDPETIIVAGESAGAHVALLAALTPGDEDLRWAQLGRMPRGAARSPRRIAQAGGRECGIGHGCPRLRRPVRLPRPAGRGRALFRAGNA